MNKNDEKRLRDILLEAQRAIDFMQGQSQNDLNRDTMRAYAITHCLLIIGEAASKVSAGTRQQYPQLEWHKMAGMRNRIIHDYGNVDLLIVWNTVEDILPTLIQEIKQILPQS